MQYETHSVYSTRPNDVISYETADFTQEGSEQLCSEQGTLADGR